MKAILTAFILAVVTINTARAEVVPYGCYVTDADREYIFNTYGEEVSCYSAADGDYSYSRHSTGATWQRNLLTEAYGPFVERVIYSSFLFYTGYNQQKDLVRKLRRACGSKCKRIK